jgi:hypothetical protein
MQNSNLHEARPIPDSESRVYVDFPAFRRSGDAQTRRAGSRHGYHWCHMWADDAEALHVMAQWIGLRRAWFQDREGFPHYDLLPHRRARAVLLGAREIDLRAFLRARRRVLGPFSHTPKPATLIT